MTATVTAVWLCHRCTVQCQDKIARAIISHEDFSNHVLAMLEHFMESLADQDMFPSRLIVQRHGEGDQYG